MSINGNRLEELLRTFTPIQLNYLAERVNVLYDYQAAEKIGISKQSISRWPNKADIDEALTLMLQDGVMVAREILRRSTAKAAQEIVDELEHRSVAVRHKAAKDILDRKIGTAPAKHEVSGPGGEVIRVALTDD